jgi:Tol biopolymer transport system component
MREPYEFRGLSLSWSPDGTKLAFTKLEGDLTWHIYTIDVQSGKMEQLTFGEKVRDYSVSWSQ